MKMNTHFIPEESWSVVRNQKNQMLLSALALQ